MNSKNIETPTQIPMVRVDRAKESSSYRPLDIPASESYSRTSCGLATAKLNHTSSTKHIAGPSSSTLAANARSATNVSTAALSKHVNAFVNSSFSATDANTCITHAPSIVLDVLGTTAVAFILSATAVQIVIAVRNKFQFQTGNLDSLFSSNSVRTSGAAASKRNLTKKVMLRKNSVASEAA